MSPERVLYHIDNSIVDRLNVGHRWNDIIYYLNENIERYKKRDSYINVSEPYLVRNWELIDWKTRMTTMLVIQSLRRINDIKWIKNNHNNFPQYGNVKIYKLVSLKDKLSIKNVKKTL